MLSLCASVFHPSAEARVLLADWQVPHLSLCLTICRYLMPFGQEEPESLESLSHPTPPLPVAFLRTPFL